MKTKLLCLSACAVAGSLCGTPLHASEPGHPATQRDKFAACAHESRGMKADVRHEFMSDCLRKRPDAAGAADEGRLAPCSAQADRRKLHGDERHAFVASCVKG